MDQNTNDVEHNQSPNPTDENQAANPTDENQDPNLIAQNQDQQLGGSPPQQPAMPNPAQPLSPAEGPRMWYDELPPSHSHALQDLYHAFGQNIDNPNPGLEVAPSRVEQPPLWPGRRRIFSPQPQPYQDLGLGLTWSQVSTPSQLRAMQNFYRSLGAEFVIDWPLPSLEPSVNAQIVSRQGNYMFLLLFIFYTQIGQMLPPLAARHRPLPPSQPQQEPELEDLIVDQLNVDSVVGRGISERIDEMERPMILRRRID